MKKTIPCFCFVLFSFSCYAKKWQDLPRLFEVAINKNESDQKEEEKKTEAIRKVSLDGVFFRNEKDWTIWINGKKFAFGESCSVGKILKVSLSGVLLLVKNPITGKTQEIFIKPSQSFVLE